MKGITGTGGLGPGLTPQDLHRRASLLQELGALEARADADPERLAQIRGQLASLEMTAAVNRGETVTFWVIDPNGYEPGEE